MLRKSTVRRIRSIELTDKRNMVTCPSAGGVGVSHRRGKSDRLGLICKRANPS